ncbi:MAG TPA: serine/threonine-protein kinase [Acidimicrobiales bacterium]|nr:serine/threonine-protein kinase [Acidimicrobiales bacterium]
MTERSYDLIARLGRGGMGVVDLARDEQGNKVALKRLTLQGSASEIARSRERLLREADVLRKLHHPNVVRLLDVIDEGDEIVLVMPYMSGGSLAERVAQHGPAPADEVERQARRLLGALASAHRAGVIHRDIKPANVLFDDRGEPCLADFGVALSRDQTHGLTVAGMVVGTPGFMAPEQARGEPVSPATDVFSLGATLLFAATGDGPYGHGDPGLLMVRAASGRVEKVPKSLPGSLRKLLRATLDARPERRPTAAGLAGLSTDGSGDRMPTTGTGHRRRAWAIAGACAAALAVVVGVVVAGSDGDADDAPVGGVADSEGACVDLPYQPCGEAEPAPGTDGSECIDDHADYDGQWENGCEAVPDDEDGRPLEDVIEANIVPADDVDTYPIEIRDTLQTGCDGSVELVLEPPPGLELALDVLDPDGAVVGNATGTADKPAVVVVGEEECGGDSLKLEVVVRPVSPARAAEDYVLRRSGDF